MDDKNMRSGPDAVPVGGGESAGPRYRAEIYDWMQSLVFTLLVCVLAFVFLARLTDVDGDSMLPTLHDEDKLFVSNLFYTPQRGDIVIFRKDSYREEPLVKRIIAVGGETVDIDFERGIVTVDGVELREDYIAELTNRPGDFKDPVTVPEGHVFVMGDNRNKSNDSRYDVIGVVDERYILGKVYFVVLPFSSMKRVT